MASSSSAPVLPVLKPINLDEIIEIPEPDLKQPPASVNPLRNLLTLTQTHYVNQPVVVEGRLGETKSTMSSRFAMSDVSVRVSRADYLAELGAESSAQMMGEMFASNFRGLNNRNLFAQKIFFIMGTLMCISFGMYAIFLGIPNVKKEFQRSKIIFISVFSVCLGSALLCLFLCSRWVRQSPHSIVVLLLSSLSLTILFGVASVHFDFLQTMMYSTGTLMVVFIIGSVLASQRKWDIASPKMISVLIIIAAFICAAAMTCKTLKFNCLVEQKWIMFAVSTTYTLIAITFIMLILRHMVFIEDLRVYEYVYAALVLYLSISTIYAFKSIYVLSKTKCSDYQRINRAESRYVI